MSNAQEIPMDSPIRLFLGCGGRPISGYVNVDLDSLDEIKQRYPGREFAPDIKVYQFDIFDLPYPDQCVDEVRADSVFEHLGFLEEKRIFLEAHRVLKPGGLFDFCVPDFEYIVRQWLDAEDNWKDWFRNDDEAIAETHWFGQYSDRMDQRWGYLTASLWGNQNGEGQVHKNCYTVPKIRAILDSLGFRDLEISHFHWQGRDRMIRAKSYRA